MKKKYVKPTTKVVGIDTEKSLLLGISGTTTPEKQKQSLSNLVKTTKSLMISFQSLGMLGTNLSVSCNLASLFEESFQD